MTVTIGRGRPWRARGRTAGSRSATLAVAGLVLGSVLLSSCTPASNAIGAPESPSCLRSIPAARLAVHGVGRFAGVRYLSARQLTADLRASEDLRHEPRPRPGIPVALTSQRTSICLVAWRGRFESGKVLAGWPPDRPPGRLALVVVRQHDAKVLVTIILEHAPIGLARVFPHLLETPVLR